jgi:DNA-binding transcriptional LysR family regulator
MPPKIDWENQIGRRLRFRDLHVFFTVAKLGSMAKAASQLGVSAPTVSEVIADLEHGLGVRLLDRSPHGVEPTMYGHAFLKRGLSAFDELRQGIRDIEFLSDPTFGQVRIGSPESISGGIPQFFHQFSVRYPNIALDIDAGFSHTMLQRLVDRSLDLVLARDLRDTTSGDRGIDFGRIGDQFNVEVLFDDELVIVAGARSPWARRRKLELSDLAGAPWILSGPESWNHQVITEAFAACGLGVPKIRMRTFSLHLRINLVERGNFIATLPKSSLRIYGDRFSLKALPVELPVRPWPVAVVTLRNRTLSPVVILFIEQLRAFAKTLTAQPMERNCNPADATRRSQAGSAPTRRSRKQRSGSGH